MTKPLSLAALWHDTLADTRALHPLALPLAAAFVLLPNVAIDLFGPPQPKTIAAMTPNALLVLLVLPSLIGLVAQAAIVRLALDRRHGVSRTVGEALAAAVRAWPLLVVVLVLGAVPISFAALLIVPAFYLAGRFAPAVPLVLDGSGPIRAIEQSWALTEGNGWRVIGFTLLFFTWFVVVSLAASLVGVAAVALLRAAGAGGAGPVIASALNGLIAAEFTVVNAVALATVYRHLLTR